MAGDANSLTSGGQAVQDQITVIAIGAHIGRKIHGPAAIIGHRAFADVGVDTALDDIDRAVKTSEREFASDAEAVHRTALFLAQGEKPRHL